MIDIRTECGIMERIEANGSLVDLAADVTAIISAVYGTIKGESEEDAELFRKCIGLIFTNEKHGKTVFEECPYIDDPSIEVVATPNEDK